MADEAEAGLEAIREGEDLAPRKVIWVGLGTAAFLVVAVAGLWFFYDWMGRSGPYREASRFPPPRLQSNPAGDLRDFKLSQSRELEGYAWADQQHGLVRVPIERVMRIVVGRGAAAYDPAPDAGPATGPRDEAAAAASNAKAGASPGRTP